MPMPVIIDRFLRDANIASFNLSAYEKLILYVLASMMGEKDTCWPSYKTLQVKCSLSRRSLIRNMAKLEKKQIIKIIRIKNGNNIYSFYPQVVSIGHQVVPNRHQVVSIRHPNNNNNNNNNKKGFLDKKKHSMLNG